MNREQFLATKSDVMTEDSPIYGKVQFRRATLKQKALARRRATVENERGIKDLDPDRLDAALMIIGSVEPKFDPTDLDALMENGDAGEISRIAGFIVGNSLPNSHLKSSKEVLTS